MTSQKEAVAKWNLIKHEKMQYINHLSEICDLNSESEYSLHHEFSEEITKNDVENVSNIKSFVKDHINPFVISPDSNKIRNLATGVVMNTQESNYLLNCLIVGEESYQNFKKERLDEKTKDLFNTIPKSNKIKKVLVATKSINIKKETIKALKYIDYDRLRTFDLAELLKFELTKTSLYLTKDNSLRKPKKSDLVNGLVEKLNGPLKENVPVTGLKTCIVIDFMAYARKTSLKNLRTFGEFVTSVWNIFQHLSSSCQRLDIILDLYIENSIKQGERERRKKTDPIDVDIININQPLPVHIDNFWASSKNKERFQIFFMSWLIESYSSKKVIYLGGLIPGDLTGCI